VKALEARIAHHFSDPALLRQALTHRSAGATNNERLEFLGDAVLGMLVSEFLCTRFPDASEGKLSRLRARLVRQGTLARLARDLRLGEHLVLGTGEARSGGANRDSILADAFEALVSALYLDAGLELCRARVEAWMQPLLDEPGDVPLKDAKTRLQEYLQARHKPLPVYEVVAVEGAGHLQEFLVSCRITLLAEPVTGSGTSRKEAEQQAASAMLERLGGDDD
jgi:ribonuclease-3